jgi:Fe-S-cluster-containing hydrogenase component 2
MAGAHLPIGCFIRIEKPDFQEVIDTLAARGYRVVGPRVADGAVILDAITSLGDLPRGVRDEQDAGRYRLEPGGDGMYFDHVVGPHSLKRYLFPPRVTVLELERNGHGWETHPGAQPGQPIAVIGVRGCDLAALRVQDRVFLADRFVNTDYAARRAGLFVIAVACGRAASTCFCTSMGTGPAPGPGFDLALTELPTHFVMEVGSEAGAAVAAAATWSPCSNREVAEAQEVAARTAQAIEERGRAGPGVPGAGRCLDRRGLHDALIANLEHPRYEEVEQRCLSCGNCTMVCPTCFCATVEEVAELGGRKVKRERLWESCFTAEHSYMNSGLVRRSTQARYRQWLTHKLATWVDQFGEVGCTGCGRCITWCPVGIDITEEVAAIRGGTA